MAGENFEEFAKILKAIAHPTRLHLLHMMYNECPCVRDMESEVGVSQPNISQHLSLMRNIGIVSSEREGNQMCYKIENQTVRNILQLMLKKERRNNNE